MRFGEAAGLARGNVDLLHRSVRIERQLANVCGHLDFAAPTTDAGYRSVSVPIIVADALVEHLERFANASPQALVFTDSRGGPLRAENFRGRVWRPTVKALGLARFDMKYSSGTLPHEKLMASIALYGEKVIPLVRDMLS